MQETLLIVGASARAAAFSLKRAGLLPLAADLFADLDLCRLCPTVKVEDYPQGIVQQTADLSTDGWIYTGALENYPEIVDRISQQRPLLGNAGCVLRRVRDPFAVAEAFLQADLPHPEVRSLSELTSREGWLQKPRRSCGGGKIQFVTGRTRNEKEVDSSCYFQRFVEGEACSAVYLAANQRATLLGVSKQMIGVEWTGAEGFCYCGSIGPVSLEQEMQNRFLKIGNCLASDFELTGLFGVDAILADGEVWPVEVNPRYTASVEVLERALSLDAISMHVEACRDGRLSHEYRSADGAICGKAILFARNTITVTEEFIDWAERANAECCWPVVADVPHVGSRVEQGQPVTSVLAEGSNPEEVESYLRQLAENVQQLLGC